MICLNDLPPERKEKAKEYLEESWPEIISELIQYRQKIGDVKVYYEVIKDDKD